MVMQFYSRQQQKKQHNEQLVNLESLGNKNEKNDDIIRKSFAKPDVQWQHVSKRRWSRQISVSQDTHEDNFFDDQFR